MPGWQALHEEFEAKGLTVLTVALDVEKSKAQPWVDEASPTHPSLIDPTHVIDRALGIVNVPMAVWIDETGTLVRPAEGASIEVSPLRSAEIPEETPDRLKALLTEVKKMPDTAEAYRDAIADWVEHGADSAYALTPEEVVARSQARPPEHSKAAALFELGCHLFETVGKDAAVPLWKEAHALHRENWTYKRQAWTLESTAEGEPSDLMQEVGDVYGTSWLDDVMALGGGENYVVVPTLD